jgi:hypothetical protein
MFRVTGTIAATILLSASDLRVRMGLRGAGPAALTDRALFEKLMASWFSSARSSEPMMRGTANEGAIFAALQAKPYIIALFECGMFAIKSVPWIACSPDAIPLVQVGDESAIASVEFTSAIACTSRDRILSFPTAELLHCTVGDADFTLLIPPEHIGQILTQMVVLSVQYVIYVAASETGIAYVVLVHCD